MRMTVTKPLTLKTKSGPKSFSPGETFNVDFEKAQPYIKQGFLKPVEDLKLLDGLAEGCAFEMKVKKIEYEQSTQTLGTFWSQDTFPRLSRLHLAGRLPELSRCPLWHEVGCLWEVSSPEVEKKVKAAMRGALGVYELEISDQLF